MCSGFCAWSARANTFNKIPKPRLWYLRCVSSVALTSTPKLRGNARIRGQVAAGPWRSPQVPGAFAARVNATHWWQISTQAFLGAGNEYWQQMHRTCTALHSILEVFQGVLTWDDSNVSMVFYGDLSLVYIEITCICKKCSNVRLESWNKESSICPLMVGTSLHRSSKCGPTLPRRLPRSHFKQNEISSRDRARDNCFTSNPAIRLWRFQLARNSPPSFPLFVGPWDPSMIESQETA